MAILDKYIKPIFRKKIQLPLRQKTKSAQNRLLYSFVID